MENNSDINIIFQARLERAKLQPVLPHTYKVNDGNLEKDNTCEGGIACDPDNDKDKNSVTFGFPVAEHSGCYSRIVYTNQEKWITVDKLYT
jgi:hypothetical protein